MSIRMLFRATLGMLTLAVSAWAAPGDTPSRPGNEEVPTLRDRSNPAGDVITPQRLGDSAVGLEGTGIDSAGKPIAGVSVKLFADGMTVTAAVTEADGSFRLGANPMRRPNGSGVLWFQSPDAAKYVDASVVLWESTAAKEHGLFSECTRSLEGSAAGQIEVTLRSVDEMQAVVVSSKCLGGS